MSLQSLSTRSFKIKDNGGRGGLKNQSFSIALHSITAGRHQLKTRLTPALLLFALVLTLAGQTMSRAVAQQPATADQVSSAAIQELAANSKKAIIGTGISEPYFNEHFRLIKVINEASDRRVEWKYSINEYETLLVDDVGYYTTEKGERVDVHSIKNELFSAYDIKRTIAKSKAYAALKSCVGEHSDALVVYRALKTPGKARLYLTARAITKLESLNKKGKKRDKEAEREIEGLFFSVGFVELETGKCTIERGKVTP